MNSVSRLLLAFVVALGGASAAYAEPIRQVPGEPVLGAKAEAVVTFRAPQVAPVRMSMRDLDLTRIAELQKRNRRENIAVQIGVNRTLAEAASPMPPLRWSKVEGGAVARLEVASPDALGLRVGLKFAAIPPALEIRVAGSLAPDLVQYAAGSTAAWQHQAGGLYWTPTTDGDKQVIELFAPAGVDTRSIRMQPGEVSHLLTNSIERFSLAKAIGDSDTCEVDVVCRVGTLGSNYVNTKNAVARMVFTIVGTGSFTCSGTLLADTVPSSQIPYFYTADHCIDSQAVASTLNTYWGFEATSCGGSVAAANVLRSGGADYLFSENDDATDAALLRLRDTPPAGAFFNGWNANALATSTSVLAVHHPEGDLKKSSLGQKMGQDSTMHAVGWTSGTTEGGSSGSGLFTATGAGGAYELRGGLWGGSATCASSGNLGNSANRDYYSRLDVVYDDIDQWLAPAATAPGPTRDYSGAWYVPAEPGWGFTAFQYNNEAQVLFILFFIYDGAGNAKWYEMGGGWTGTDVRSGDMLQSTANQGWGATYSGRSFSDAGDATLTFTSATSATLSFTVNGVTRNVTVQKL